MSKYYIVGNHMSLLIFLQEILEAFKVSKNETEAKLLAKMIPSPRIIQNPKLDEDKALQTWNIEMSERKAQMKKLAGLFVIF